jgi:hypothetical protein
MGWGVWKPFHTLRPCLDTRVYDASALVGSWRIFGRMRTMLRARQRLGSCERREDARRGRGGGGSSKIPRPDSLCVEGTPSAVLGAIQKESLPGRGGGSVER